MTKYNKRVFEMLVRVLVFRLSIQELLDSLSRDKNVGCGL